VYKLKDRRLRRRVHPKSEICGDGASNRLVEPGVFSLLLRLRMLIPAMFIFASRAGQAFWSSQGLYDIAFDLSTGESLASWP